MSAFSDDPDSMHPAPWPPLSPGSGVKASAQAASTRWNYEATVAEVEAIIRHIEAGDLELAEVFDQFAIAVEHLQRCETFLSQQKERMDLLIETLADEPTNF